MIFEILTHMMFLGKKNDRNKRTYITLEKLKNFWNY